MAHLYDSEDDSQVVHIKDDSQSLPDSTDDDDDELQFADLVTRQEAADFFVCLSSQLFRSHPEATYELMEQLASRFGLSALRLEEGACGAARAAGQARFDGPRLALQAELQKLSRWRDTLSSLNGALAGSGVRRAGAAAAAAAAAAMAAAAGGYEAAEADPAAERMRAVTGRTTAQAAPARFQPRASAATASQAHEWAARPGFRRVVASNVVVAYVSWLRSQQGMQLPLLEGLLEQQGCSTGAARNTGVARAYNALPDAVLQRLAAHLQPFLDADNAQRLVEFELAAAAGEEPQRRSADAERNQERGLASRYAAWEEQQQVPPLHTLLGWGEPVPLPEAQQSVWQVPSGWHATADGAAATNSAGAGAPGGTTKAAARTADAGGTASARPGAQERTSPAAPPPRQQPADPPARLQPSASTAATSQAAEWALGFRKIFPSYVAMAYISRLRKQGMQLPLLERLLEQQGCSTGVARTAGIQQACKYLPNPVKQRLAAHLQPFLDAVNAQRLEEYELAAAAGEEPQRRNAYAERNQGRDLASRYAAWEEEQQQVPPLHTLLGWGEPVPVPGSRRSVWQVPSGRQATANGAAATDNAGAGAPGGASEAGPRTTDADGAAAAERAARPGFHFQKIGPYKLLLAYVRRLRDQGMQLPLLERMLEQQGCSNGLARNNTGIPQAYKALPDAVLQRLTAHLQPFLDAVNAQRLVEFERAVAAGGKPKREHADVERREGRDLASRYAAWEGQQQEQVPPLHTMLGWGEPVPVPGAQRSAGHIPSGRRAVTSGAATTNNEPQPSPVTSHDPDAAAAAAPERRPVKRPRKQPALPEPGSDAEAGPSGTTGGGRQTGVAESEERRSGGDSSPGRPLSRAAAAAAVARTGRGEEEGTEGSGKKRARAGQEAAGGEAGVGAENGTGLEGGAEPAAVMEQRSQGAQGGGDGEGGGTGDVASEGRGAEASPLGSAGRQAQATSNVSGSPAPRKRGRPKGSKNVKRGRPKGSTNAKRPQVVAAEEATAEGEGSEQAGDAAPDGEKDAGAGGEGPGVAAAAAEARAAGVVQRGRPEGSKGVIRPKEAAAGGAKESREGSTAPGGEKDAGAGGAGTGAAAAAVAAGPGASLRQLRQTPARAGRPAASDQPQPKGGAGKGAGAKRAAPVTPEAATPGGPAGGRAGGTGAGGTSAKKARR